MYILPKDIDSDKVFLVQRSELIGRFDAPAYKNGFSFTSEQFPIKRLSEIAFINPSTSFRKLDPETEISFVPMEAIDELNGTITTLQTKRVADANGFTRFMENDLIWAKITPCMQNGKSAIVRNTINGLACGSTEFFVIRPKTYEVKVEYLHLLLRDKRILEHAQNFFGGTAGQQRVSREYLVNFSVPLPPLNIQEEIITLYKNAQIQKQQKENDAKNLLSSIDKYLLNELDIRTAPQDNSLQRRVFITKLSKITGDRFDAFAILNKEYKIEGGVYENRKLKSLATLVKGQSITSDKITEGKYPVIAGGQTSPYNHNEYNHSGNIITVSASGAYSGYVWYHDSPIFASDCTVIKSKDENEITTLFLFEILKARQLEIYNLQQGAGQPHVYAKDLEKLNIPVPSSNKQIEIVAHIQNIRNRAKVLQQEAKQLLESAKQQIEQMILGS